MLIKLDRQMCRGHARCNAEAPELFPLDDGGYCAIDELRVTPDIEELALDGADACPEGALRVDDQS